MPEMTPNVDLLERTLAHIEAHPDEWRQDEWRCRTACCFAGRAAILAGARWAYPASASRELRHRVTSPDGKEWIVPDYAARMLRLDALTAHRLFGSENTIQDLRRIVAEIKTEAGKDTDA